MTNKTAKGLLTRGAVLVLLLAACVSCSPKIVERIVVQHDTTTVHHRDTTYQREFGNLKAIRDNYPKYVIRMDDFAGGNYEGVKTMHIADFLLDNSY